MKFKHKNKVALVTGASSGFGESLSRLLVFEGWDVVGVARREQNLHHLKELLGNRFHFKKCDVSSFTQIKKVSAELRKEHFAPSLFFLNAGYLNYEKNNTFSLEDHKKNFDVNYFGAMAWVEEWLPHCLEHGGTFVGISSLASKLGMPNLSSYCATKAALAKAFQSLQIQYYGSKANFVSVLPGFIDTPLLKSKAKTPFIVQPLKAARYTIDKVFEGKTYISFPFIYRFLTFIAALAPISLLNKVFKKHPTNF